MANPDQYEKQKTELVSDRARYIRSFEMILYYGASTSMNKTRGKRGREMVKLVGVAILAIVLVNWVSIFVGLYMAWQWTGIAISLTILCFWFIIMRVIDDHTSIS